jgi:microcystin-dependent protein
MSSPFVGEIRMFGGNFAPQGWAFCDGSLQPISGNDVLFALIGTTYGGDGQTTFALPDLRGRIPVHPDGSNFQLAQAGGTETVTLTVPQLPQHGHAALSGTGTAANSPGGNTWGAVSGSTPYTDQSPNAQMNAQNIFPTGGNQPHDNFMPYLCVSFIISLFGIFPSQT